MSTLLVGIPLIIAHTIWTLDWYVVITLISWFIFLKEIIRFCFPNAAQKIAQFYQKFYALMIFGIICLGLGLFLMYHGIFM